MSWFTKRQNIENQMKEAVTEMLNTGLSNTVTITTVEYKLKDDPAIYKRKNCSGFKREKNTVNVFIFVPGATTFEKVVLPLKNIEYMHFDFQEKEKWVRNDNK